MADETLNITVVETNDGTNKLVSAVNNLAKSSEDLANSTDKSVAASKQASSARDTEAASTTKAATAVRGYVDETGTYVRLVGSQATGVRAAADAQSSLTASLSATGSAATSAASGTAAVTTSLSGAAATGASFSASVADLNRQLAGSGAASQQAATGVRGFVDAQGNYVRAVGSQAGVTKDAYDATLKLGQATGQGSIEAGRAAAGYGALNPVLTQAQVAARELTSGLAGAATSVQAAGVGLGQAGAGANAAAVGLNNGRSAFQSAGAAATTAATGMRTVGAAGAEAAGGATTAAGALRAAGAAAAAAEVPHRSLGAAMGGVGASALSMAGALGGIGAALGLGSIIKATDTWAQMSNRLRLVTTDQTKLNAIMDTAYEIAQKTSTPVTEIANLYGKLSTQGKSLGLSAQGAKDATTSLALALQASGATGQQSASAIQQFSQGLAKGKLEANDFKIILESAPAVANAMTAGLARIGVTVQGSLAEALTKGTVSAKQMLDALVAIKPTMEDFAATALPTVANAFTRLENSYNKFIGQSAEANAGAKLIMDGLDGIGRNLNVVIPLLTAVAGVLALGAFAAAATAITGFATAIGAAVVAMGALPIAITAAVAGAAALLFNYTSLGDKIKAAFTGIPGAVKPGTDAVKGAADTAGTSVTSLADKATKTAEAINAAGTAVRTGSDGIRTIGGAAVAAGIDIDKLKISTVGAAASVGTAATSVRSSGAGFTELSATAGRVSNSLVQIRDAATGTTQPFITAGTQAQVAAFKVLEIAKASGVATKSWADQTQAMEMLIGGYKDVQNDVAPGVVTIEQFNQALAGTLPAATATAGAFNEVNVAAATYNTNAQQLAIVANNTATANRVMADTAGAAATAVTQQAASVALGGTAAQGASAAISSASVTAVAANDNHAASVGRVSARWSEASQAANGWTAAGTRGAQVYTQVGAGASTAADQIRVTTGSMSDLSAALDMTVGANERLDASLRTVTTSFGSFSAAADESAVAAKKAAAARDELAAKDRQSAVDAKQYADNLRKVGTEFNAYGEKLESISSFLSKAKKAQDDFDSSLAATRKFTLDAAAALNNYGSGFSDVNAHIGEFSQATIDATASMSNLEKSSNSSISTLNGLSGAYAGAAQAASGYASAAAQAAFENNTVKGQIGGGTLQGLDPTDFAIMQSAYGNGLAGLSPAELHANQLNRLSNMAQTNPYNTKIREALEAEMKAGKSQDTLAQEAVVDSAKNKAASMAALDAAGIDENGRPLKAGESNVKGNVGQSTTATTAAVPKVTAAAASAPTTLSSIGANNGASATASVSTMNVQTLNVGSMGSGSAANSNSLATAAANVPAGSTNTLQGAALPTGGSTTAANSNGSLGAGVPVGTSVTTVTTQTGAMVDPASTGRPSDDVLTKMNGGFDPGPSAVGPAIPGLNAYDDGAGNSGFSGTGKAAAAFAQQQIINLTIKSDDFGQFKQSQRQIAADIGTRVMRAAN